MKIEKKKIPATFILITYNIYFGEIMNIFLHL